MITLFNIRPKGFNVGNDAIAISLRKYIYDAFGSVVNIVTIPATTSYNGSNYAGLTAKTIYDINQYADGVIVGGGNLYENGELEVSLDALEAMRVPMMLFSLSYGRVYNKERKFVRRTDAMPDRIIKGLHKKSCISLARDRATEAHLKGLGCDNVVLGGCPTLFLNRIESQLPKLPDVNSGALISIRSAQLMSIPPAHQARVYGDIQSIISFLHDNGFNKVRILCHDHRDISFALSFPHVDFIYTSDVYDYLTILQRAEINISYRLHACLPCLAFDTPTIKISYDERGVDLMETIKCSDINVNMMQCDNTIAMVENSFRTVDSSVVKKKATDIWDHLDRVMESSLQTFVQHVKAYKNHLE